MLNEEFKTSYFRSRKQIETEFFKNIDISELKEKIRIYRLLDLTSMNDKEVEDAINHVITFDTPRGKMSGLSTFSNKFPIGTRFYRVRQLEPNDRTVPLKAMSTISDCWEAPKDVVNKGRLNKPQETLLYVSLSPNTAIEELEIPNNQLCSIIVYEAVSPINITEMHFPRNLEKMNIESQRIIHEFLNSEFSRSIKDCSGHIYTISEIITKMFDLPPEGQDAWCYQSVAKESYYNLCIISPANKKLKLIGVQIASVERHTCNKPYEYTVKCIAINSGSNKNLDYYKIGSKKQKEIFPEIIPD